jgi:hypothetical protein
MKMNAPINPDYDLLNDRNSILIPNTSDNIDIFTELGFDKTTYMKALETRKQMQKLHQSNTNTSINNNVQLPTPTKYKKFNNRPIQRTKVSNTIYNNTSNNIMTLNNDLSSIELNTDLDNSILDNELNNI